MTRARRAELVRSLALILPLGLLSCRGGPAAPADPCRVFRCDNGGIVRGDTSVRRMSLVFTGGSFADGGFSASSSAAPNSSGGSASLT